MYRPLDAATSTVGDVVNEDLQVGRFVIPAEELWWTFGPSGGPGGQHANRAHTRATLHWSVADARTIPYEQMDRIMESLAPRLVDGTLVVTADDSRSQWRNRAIARNRLAEMVEMAMRPKVKRRRTKPSRAAKQRRLDEKRRQSDKKRLRGSVEPE